jgi:hypothetical protein
MQKLLDKIGELPIPDKSDFDRWEAQLKKELTPNIPLKDMLVITFLILLMFAVPIFLLYLAEYYFVK